MTYLDRATDECGRIEFDFHLDYKDILLIRNCIREYAYNLEKDYLGKNIGHELLLGLFNIKMLVQMDNQEVKFRINRLNILLKLIENGLHTNTTIPAKT